MEDDETLAFQDWNNSPASYSLPSYAPVFAKYMSSLNHNQSISGMRPALRSPVSAISLLSPKNSDSPVSRIRPPQSSAQASPSQLFLTSFHQSRSQVRSPLRSHRSLVIQNLDLACKHLYPSTSLVCSPLKSLGTQYLDSAVTDLHPSISLMRPPIKSLTERKPDLTLTNLQYADGAGSLFQSKDVQDQPRLPRCSLVGRFLVDGGIEMQIHTMEKKLADLWKPSQGLCIIDLGPNRFQFDFYNELDRDNVIKGGPWTIEGHFLLTKKLETGQNPHEVPLFHSDFWVRIDDLPTNFITMKVAIDIGNRLGEFVEADETNFFATSMRIRVSIDIRRPLTRKMDISHVYGKCIPVRCSYGRLSTYCFYCEKFGHFALKGGRCLIRPQTDVGLNYKLVSYSSG